MEASETRGTTALVNLQLHSSLYTGTVHVLSGVAGVHPTGLTANQGCRQVSTKITFSLMNFISVTVTVVAQCAKLPGIHGYVAGSIPAVKPRYCTVLIQQLMFFGGPKKKISRKSGAKSKGKRLFVYL